MVLNGGIANIAVIVNCGQWSDVVIHDINIEKKIFIVYSPDCEFRGAHLKCFRITIFVNRAECTQRLITRLTFMNQLSFYRLFCVCADERKIYAVAVDGVGLGMCL